MEKELLFGVLTKTYSLSEQELSDLLYEKSDGSDELTLKEGAMDILLEKDVQRVKKLQADVKPSLDQKEKEAQFSRGKKEALEELENEVKEKFGLQESENKGFDLVAEAIKKETKSKPDKLTDEDVKKHSVYLDLEKNSVPKSKYEELENTHNEFIKNQEKSEILSKVNETALEQLELLEPIHSKNPIVKANRIKDFLEKLKQWDYQPQPDNNHLIIDGNGNRLEDGHGNPISFNDFIKENASLYFDFQIQTNKGSPGNQNGDGSGSSDIKAPTSKEEYSRMVFNEPDPEKRIKIKQLAKEAGVID